MAQETSARARPALTQAPILITAATRWEADPLAVGLGLRPSEKGYFEGLLGGRRVVLIKTGIGATKTATALEHAVPSEYGLAISAGLCGSLRDDVRATELVADVEGTDLDLVLPLREIATAQATTLHFGRILHTNIVLQAATKRRLGVEHRALACDMETAAVRRWATHASLASIGLRAVLDQVDEDLPSDSPDGEDFLAMARYALARPARLPRLIGTGWRCSRAMRVLTRFLKAYLEAL